MTEEIDLRAYIAATLNELLIDLNVLNQKVSLMALCVLLTAKALGNI